MSNPSAAQNAAAQGAAAAPAKKPPANLNPQTGPKAARPQQQDLVFTWPHLVSIEAIQAIVMTLAFVIMSILVNAPLTGLADPETTPNPSKAPWYFLGLQELLLHMHPGLAGVIVPSVVLILLAAIPYVDRRRKGTAVWFNGKLGLRIFWFSSAYTTLWLLALIVVDEWLHIPGVEGSHGIQPLLTQGLGLPNWIGMVLVPSLFMVYIPWLLVELVKRRYSTDTRDIMIALYTFFFISFWVLTIIGTGFRGEDMALMWPWDVKPHF